VTVRAFRCVSTRFLMTPPSYPERQLASRRP